MRYEPEHDQAVPHLGRQGARCYGVAIGALCLACRAHGDSMDSMSREVDWVQRLRSQCDASGDEASKRRSIETWLHRLVAPYSATVGCPSDPPRTNCRCG